jgi:hypothetical protein
VTNYTIEFTDIDKTNLLIPERSYNAQTPLILHGKNSINYSKDLNSNLLHLLEHFSNDDEPINSIIGQLWYDTSDNNLKVKSKTEWIDLGYSKKPKQPTDAITEHDLGIKLNKYLPLSNGMMSGPLLLKPLSDNASGYSAVTKEFVDKLKPSGPTGFIPLTGNPEPTSGPIISNVKINEFSSEYTAITKKYVDDNLPVMTITNEVILTNGCYSIVTFLPSKLTYIYGVAYLGASDTNTTIKLDDVSNLINYSVNSNTFDADAVSNTAVKLDFANKKGTITITKSGVVASTVMFTIIGYSA